MMAMENENVQAEVIDATSFPDMAGHYEVRGVPKTVINEQFTFDGAVPENVLLQQILQAVGA
jgi:predicted DsbA family dithiol-disulfide isomerase